jgi:hypothetical protein
VAKLEGSMHNALKQAIKKTVQLYSQPSPSPVAWCTHPCQVALICASLWWSAQVEACLDGHQVRQALYGTGCRLPALTRCISIDSTAMQDAVSLLVIVRCPCLSACLHYIVVCASVPPTACDLHVLPHGTWHLRC